MSSSTPPDALDDVPSIEDSHQAREPISGPVSASNRDSDLDSDLESEFDSEFESESESGSGSLAHSIPTPPRALLIGTAGHIDHGKSSLVRALTGIDPDRLPEEKKRGISIELGFASGPLAEGIEASFIDVPGHERFVRTMVAGAHAVDVVLLTVALDEGVMPQTREHAEVCRLLGITRAVVALTRSDLAEPLGPRWRELVEEDVCSLGAPFDEAECIAVSARTGDGLLDLRHALLRAGAIQRPRPTGVPALLPIDRAFTLRGHGTVVTGTLVSGTLATGDPVELVVPASQHVRVHSGLRVRSLQVHGNRVTGSGPGRRVAVNIPGLELADVARGSALAAAKTGSIRSGAQLNVELQLVSRAPPLKNRSRVTFHAGTAQAQATIDLLGRTHLAAGERAVAQVRLDRALPTMRGQHFILRGFHVLPQGGKTLGGGRILAIDQRRRRVRDRQFVQSLNDNAWAALAALVRDSKGNGLATEPTLLRLGIDGPGALSRDLEKTGTTATSAPHLHPALPSDVLRIGGRLFDSRLLTEQTEALRKLIRERSGMTPEDARSSLGHRIHPLAFSWMLERLGEGFLVGDTLRVDEASVDPLSDMIVPLLVRAGLEPPTVDELVRLTGATRKDVLFSLRRLVETGHVVRLTRELYVDAGAAKRFRGRVLAALAEKESLTTGELKTLAGTSRKFAIPLCEWLDRERVTLRVGDRRVPRRR